MPFADPTSAGARRSRNRKQARWRKTPAGRAYNREVLREKRRAAALARPFVGVDGEGAGEDRHGRQRYQILRAGEDVIRDPRGLSSRRCLAFLADLPPDPLYVGYFFDYDATQILRDLPAERRERLFQRTHEGHFVSWEGFEIDYLPRKYLRVRREGAPHWRTVSDVGSFFQEAFVGALDKWKIGTARERAEVMAGKKRRGGARLTARDARYNALECRLLAQLMTAFRQVCHDAGVVPSHWRGPGYIASAILRAHDVPKRKELSIPLPVLVLANASYVGGRFEFPWIGDVPGPIWGHDINSAYPHALRALPCLAHGRWKRGRGPPGALYLADASHRKRDPHLCDLPVRVEGGTITWPARGRGVYWSVELDAARRAGTRVKIHRAWHYVPACKCRPFDWVEALYEERRRIGKSTRGYPIKLALNSIYGKTAQAVGTAPYANPVWASLITAITRAALIDAYRKVPSRAIVGLATDGIFARRRLPVREGAGLGAWEVKKHGAFFVVQPGFYFGAARPKTRGAPLGVVTRHEQEFRRAWARWDGRGAHPSVSVPLVAFLGLKLATARHRPLAAGRWVRAPRVFSFDPASKRTWVGKGRPTRVLPGGPARSVPYAKVIGRWRDELEQTRELLDAMPDYTPAG